MLSCKTIILLSLMSLFSGVLVPVSAFAENLLPNHDFSRGLSEWQTRFQEENEKKYWENHKHVTVVANPVGSGRALRLTLPRAVAASQGVKVQSQLMEVKPGKSYMFGAEIISEGPTPKIILEGYTEDSQRQTKGADQIPGYRRIYRAVIHPDSVDAQEWSTHSREISPPSRYQPSHVLIKLYAYWPKGTIYFNNVELRKTD